MHRKRGALSPPFRARTLRKGKGGGKRRGGEDGGEGGGGGRREACSFLFERFVLGRPTCVKHGTVFTALGGVGG